MPLKAQSCRGTMEIGIDACVVGFEKAEWDDNYKCQAGNFYIS